MEKICYSSNLKKKIVIQNFLSPKFPTFEAQNIFGKNLKSIIFTDIFFGDSKYFLSFFFRMNIFVLVLRGMKWMFLFIRLIK